MASKAKKTAPRKSTGEIVEAFDRGEDISRHIAEARSSRRVNVDFPAWMVAALDAEAARLDVPRQAIIKMWIDERLKQDRKDDDRVGA